MLTSYCPSTRRFATSTAILRTLLFCSALMATLRAVLLFNNLMAIAFFTACVSFGCFFLRDFPEIPAKLFLQEIQERLLAVGQIALFGGYDLVEVLCVVGYHGALQVVVYDPRADV